MYKNKSLLQLSFLLLFLTGFISIDAQVSVNTDGTDPDPSAMMDLQSSSRGFLMPRMTENDRLAISSPSSGLLLFQTDNTSGFYYNEGSPSIPTWVKMPALLETSSLICDTRIPIDSVWNGNNYKITESGSYFFTDSIFFEPGSGNIDGIVIKASNVTLDLNGYSFRGGNNTDNGIYVQGDQDNIIIKNGIVIGWGGDGIQALSADQSIFRDLIIKDNGGDGIITDFNCLIYKCQAKGNFQDGLETDDGSVIAESSASENGDNGIKTSEGCIVVNCTSWKNEKDGIDVDSGSKIENCNAYENGFYGIDVGLGGQVINCMANKNGANGIDVASSGLIMNNVANNNGTCWNDGSCSISDDGAGIRTMANSQIVNNTCNDNIQGIVIAASDSYVDGNYCEGNQHAGLVADHLTTGSFLIRNRCFNNGFNPLQALLNTGNDPSGNIVITAASAYGPIINVSSAGDISGTTNANHPYANFEY